MDRRVKSEARAGVRRAAEKGNSYPLDRDLLLKHKAEDLEVDFFGVADLAPVRDFIVDQGGDWLAEFPVAVSIGITLPHAIVDQLPRRSERGVGVSYRTHAYNFINARLDQAASRVASHLQRQGWHSLPVPASKRVDKERICALFSHKLAAHIAGLGWIGKSCLLVTPQVGPRVRWATVLTQAPLARTGEPMESRCGDCRLCVDICPVQAFSGRNFIASEPRAMRYDAALCDRYVNKGLLVKDPEAGVCGMCLYICPHGRQASQNLHPI
jgi:epoxyqueuosine reductase